MADNEQFKSTVRFLKDADDIMFLLTGQRFRQLVPRAIDLFGESLIKRVIKEKPPPLDPDDPYSILEVRQDASNLVVKAAYRSKVKVLHPDTGTNPDPKEFQRVVEAYEKVMRERDYPP